MIDIICPSRNRPELCREMAESALSNAKGDVRILVGIDDNDPKRKEYEAIDGVEVFLFANPNGGCASVANNLAKKTTADLVQFIGDDCLMVTEAWDEKMLSHVPEDGIAWICPINKESKERRQPYHPAVTREWLNIVGWFTYPEIHHYGTDTIIYYIARSVCRDIWADDVVVEHRHYKRHPNGIQLDDNYTSNEALVAIDNKIQNAGKSVYAEKIRLLKEAIEEKSCAS